jgi:hypothetical protein
LAIWVNAGGGAAGTTAVLVYLATSYGTEWVEAWIRKKLSKGDDVAEFKAELIDAINALAYQELSVSLGKAARVDVKSGILKYF